MGRVMVRTSKALAIVGSSVDCEGDVVEHVKVIAVGQADLVEHAAEVLGGAYRAVPLPSLTALEDVQLAPEFRVGVGTRLVKNRPAVETFGAQSQTLRALREPEGVWRQLWLGEVPVRPGPLVWALSHASMEAARDALAGVMHAAAETGPVAAVVAPLVQDLPAGFYREGRVSGTYRSGQDVLEVNGARAFMCRDVSGQRLELFVELPEEHALEGETSESFWAGLDAELDSLRAGSVFAFEYDGATLTVSSCVQLSNAEPMAWVSHERHSWFPDARGALDLRG